MSEGTKIVQRWANFYECCKRNGEFPICQQLIEDLSRTEAAQKDEETKTVEDLRELYESRAIWDGNLMLRFSKAHGIPVPYEGADADGAVRRYLIKRVSQAEAERDAAQQAQADSDMAFKHANELVGKYMDDADAAQQKVRTLRDALEKIRQCKPCPLCTNALIARAALAATAPAPVGKMGGSDEVERVRA